VLAKLLDKKGAIQGLRRLHTCYDPPDRSAAQGHPCHEGSSPSGHPAEPLVSYQINRQFTGWILPPQVIRAFGAHCQEQTYGPAESGTAQAATECS
jgi:hypothetical protein